jgi:DNA-binding NtrC family response regulator
MKARVAVVDDEPIVLTRVRQALTKDGHEVEPFAEAQAFMARNAAEPFDVVLLDLRLKDAYGLDLLPDIKAARPDTEVVFITGYGSIDNAIEAVRLGAFHYVLKPLKLAEIRGLVQNALEKIALKRENARLRQALRGEEGLGAMVGTSPGILQVFELIRKVAPLDCTVLIAGDSGTGKELVARAIHAQSQRKNRPFVAFNCGGFTDELINSELFGYEKGAFTGAAATKLGLLETASGGTVFLDEIGEMPLSMQVKLLHVIQEKRILRVGGVKPISLDIRIIAASNKNLKHEVGQGTFREDLFYRLNVVSISLPRLEERREDIPLLIKHFMGKYSLAFSKQVTKMAPQAMRILENYSYPGNIRELENIVERAVALTDTHQIRSQDLPRDVRQLEVDAVAGEGLSTLTEMERSYIAKVLKRAGHNKGLAAQILNIPRTTLWRKLKALGLE